ncbi:hypothetical protein [Nocardioides deserti]|uniref:Type I restriction enzyme R protein N-terminal domain-containing protein n=1 Tax=Nocardioides deserti TaxID=1588644 RepID=A0ABR6U4R6_9ACTN|nr:hypothetical protein [Nocardioides deserti]MBC2959383.1 hypothetical protein [Nocardioides deserti]GGO73342.1 hypothetical protein GCM10012276_18690 [Nocardioides deserti]
MAGDNKEAVLQKYIFEHLWLLDPGWDKATVPVMEQAVSKLIQKQGVPKDRFDIKYRVSGTNHVVVELKRSNRKVSTAALIEQINKYRYPILGFLKDTEGTDVELQTVCLVGEDLSDWKHEGGREASRQQLAAINARVVKYDKLIKDAKQSYEEYLDAHKKLGTVREVLAAIEDALGAAQPGSD